MEVAQSLRWLVPLAAGLLVGGVGAAMFLQSMPGAVGSEKERADQLEVELKRTQNRVAALESVDQLSRDRQGTAPAAEARRRTVHTLADEARSIADDLRAGRPVSPNDIFRATQPLLRDLAPLFDRMRLKQQQAVIDSMTGELARKYGLTPQNQEVLKQWFAGRAQEEAKRWSELLAADGTRLEDVMRASRDVRPDQGIESVMSGLLSAEKYAAFQTERLTERAGRVQQEADAKVQRLDQVVTLDETQRDQIFGIMARGSREYDPAMKLEGTDGDIGPTPSGNRQAAILAVLRPDQRATYEAEKQRRRGDAEKDMASMGLALPLGSEWFDDDAFR